MKKGQITRKDVDYQFSVDDKLSTNSMFFDHSETVKRNQVKFLMISLGKFDSVWKNFRKITLQIDKNDLKKLISQKIFA